MTSNQVSTSVRISPELKERLAAIKERSAVIEFLLIGRQSKYAGWGIEDVLLRGAAAAEAEIAAVWTAEHERRLRSLPPPATSRGTHGPRVRDALVEEVLAAARDAGFGPETPLEDMKAEAVRLHDQHVPDTRIGELFGRTGGRVQQWRKAAEAHSPDRKARARSRSAGNGAVKHATPVTFRAAP